MTPRRKLLAGAGALPVLIASGKVFASTSTSHSFAGAYAEAILAFTDGKIPQAGRVRLDIAVLVDNGNTVPIHVSVDEKAIAPALVEAIAVINERNPQQEVAVFRFGAGTADAWVSTRIRLATSQKLIAIARLSDGSFWSHEMEVIVTLAACIEP